MKKILALLIINFLIFAVSIFADCYGSAGLALQYMERDGFGKLNKTFEDACIGKIKGKFS